jgi:beta-lactam-binding protein with PASTA domain/tRNA A-37 threonylcarbamoyl transferase component Bud32
MTTTEPKRLGGRYELGELLGRGGMAEVHRGQDVRLGRTVAIKTLRTDLARDPTFQARFRREAQSAASLNHPAVVAVYDTGEDHGVDIPYIVMEYVDGYTLRELLQSDRRLMPERALEITAGVLQALDYSHRQGIIHRDIKPANVMLTRSGDIKVMDFGIARAVADTAATMTATAAVIGTAQYLSPEQARGERVDARSDLYSTGCLLYELLTGRPPFVGDSPVAVAYQHVREDPLPPSQFDPEIPPEVDAIVLKALAKHPDNRYQSAAEMRADIERALAGMPVEATPVLGVAPLGGATQRFDRIDSTSALPMYDEGQPPRRRWPAYLLLALAIIAVFAGSVLVGRALFAGNDTQTVGVPSLRGLTKAQAQAELKKVNLTLGAQEQRADETVPKDRIISQNPTANTRVDEGSSVSIVLSTGPPVAETVAVPSVIGKKRDAAAQLVREAGLSPRFDEQDDPTADPGEVIDSDPKPGTDVKPGSTVTLIIASDQSGTVKVPNVVGQQEKDARRLLESLGFDVNVERENAEEPKNAVFRQDPEDGGRVQRGSDVTIFVSRGPEEQSSSPSPSASATTSSPGGGGPG